MGEMNLTSSSALGVAGVTVSLAVIISIVQILCHLRYYIEPVYQRYIVRIVFMVPVYSICSYLSLIFSEQHIYFDTVRDMYEAWILYNFLSLCLAYIGGPGAVVSKSDGKNIEPSFWYCTCCVPQMPVNGLFLRRCKQGVLQFVLIKPILASLTLMLYNLDAYEEGSWGAKQGYLWIQILYNICYTVALYALVLFYQGTEELLAPFRPLLKFVLVKAVIFLTFWQGLLVSLLGTWGYIDSARQAKDLQNFLICIEMLGAAILLLFAFPHQEYKISGGTGHIGATNVRHAVSIRDVVSDTIHQFAPQYHDYVLYSDDTTGKPKTVRTRTFVKMGEETTRFNDRANLLAHVEMRRMDSRGADDDTVASSGPQSRNATNSSQPDAKPRNDTHGKWDSEDFSQRGTTDLDIEMSGGDSEATGEAKEKVEEKKWVHIDLGDK